MTQLKIARLTAEERKQIEAEEILRIIAENTHHLLDIELEVELDFGTIFCWIRRGLKTLGVCTHKVDKDIWYAKSYYRNPNGTETRHSSPIEAIYAVVTSHPENLAEDDRRSISLS